MRVILSLLLLWGMAAAASHPLDPLTKDEIALAVSVLKNAGKATEANRFPIGAAVPWPPEVPALNIL